MGPVEILRELYRFVQRLKTDREYTLRPNEEGYYTCYRQEVYILLLGSLLGIDFLGEHDLLN